MSKRHIIIPDSHATPEHNNDRYDWLGQFIYDRRPDVVVNIGDHWDMNSICSHDRQKTEYHSRRYQSDVASGIEANDRLFNKFKKMKKRLPKRIFNMGNHENRINRLVSENAVLLEGTIGIEDLQLDDYYDIVNPVENVVTVDGVAYSHYFTSGIMNRPIGGKNHARSLIINGHVSCVCGHSHFRDYAEDIRFDGKRIQALVVGCYFDYHMDYAGLNNSKFWRGVVELNDVQDGEFEASWYSLDQLKNEYS